VQYTALEHDADDTAGDPVTALCCAVLFCAAMCYSTVQYLLCCVVLFAAPTVLCSVAPESQQLPHDTLQYSTALHFYDDDDDCTTVTTMTDADEKDCKVEDGVDDIDDVTDDMAQ
jgi:hypothetical protein